MIGGDLNSWSSDTHTYNSGLAENNTASQHLESLYIIVEQLIDDMATHTQTTNSQAIHTTSSSETVY